MRLMDKYILRSFIAPLLYCLLAFIMVVVVWDLFDNLTKFLDTQTPFRVILLYYAYFLLPSLEYLIPASLLLATLYTLWQFTANSELTAMRAVGVGLSRIVVPFLAIGFIASAGSLLIKETIAPRANAWIEEFKQVKLRGLGSNNNNRGFRHYNSKAHRIWEVDEFDANTRHRLIGVSVKQERDNGTTAEIITAEKAEWLDGAWWFFDATSQKYHESGVPDGKPMQLDPSKEFRRFNETPSDFIIEVSEWAFLSSMDMWLYLKRHSDLSSQAMAQKTFDLHGRLAMPWACFIVTLFGVPAGARTGRQSILAGILLAMTFFFGFYALSQVGLFLGKRQIIWPWIGAWLSNIVFLSAGLCMMRRMR